MIKFFHPRGVQELFWRAGQTTEKVAFRRLTKKYPKQARKAHKLAQLKGLKKVESLGKRHGVEGLFSVKDKPRSYFKTKKGGLPRGVTLEEMGWAPSAPLSAEAIAVKRAQSPKALLKKHRATLTKIYRAPKSWKPRAELKRHYRTKAKMELGQAKVDRAIFRTQSVQKLDPKTGMYKTIRKYKKYTY